MAGIEKKDVFREISMIKYNECGKKKRMKRKKKQWNILLFPFDNLLLVVIAYMVIAITTIETAHNIQIWYMCKIRISKPVALAIVSAIKVNVAISFAFISYNRW